jgi:triacylglycerol esterase/lipase EstA (alpha/beta hydrolase family)
MDLEHPKFRIVIEANSDHLGGPNHLNQFMKLVIAGIFTTDTPGVNDRVWELQQQVKMALQAWAQTRIKLIEEGLQQDIEFEHTATALPAKALYIMGFVV